MSIRSRQRCLQSLPKKGKFYAIENRGRVISTCLAALQALTPVFAVRSRPCLLARQRSIPVASRIGGFVYAIRNIVAEARRVEAAGTRGSLPQYRRPDHFRLPDAAPSRRGGRARDSRRAQRLRAVGRHRRAREAVADECGRRGMPLSADRVVLTSGTSEGIELALTALAEAGDEVLVPVPTYPLYTAVLAKIGARRGLLPDGSGAAAGCRISITSAA